MKALGLRGEDASARSRGEREAAGVRGVDAEREAPAVRGERWAGL